VEGAGGMMPTAGNVMLQIGRRDKRKQCFFEKKHQKTFLMLSRVASGIARHNSLPHPGHNHESAMS
jgi:hypothetical protein